jgi:hypothetical protein
MKTFRMIQQYLSNHCETRENHEDPSLCTHYYKTTNTQALKAIEGVISKQPGFQITSISKEYGEVSVQVSSPKKAFLVISAVSVRPLETAVDFSVSFEGLLSLGYCRDIVIKLYRELDEKLVQI